ncbi:hypothetical protein M0R45_033551 [Rubus argutus]|uniref:Gibberellin regulated protein n=1 Tax=Rubus argutus TaxID=59490 RepID=A0AAW1WMU3_RUBAR
MAFKIMLLLCASLLLIITRVSSYDHHEKVKKKDKSELQSLFSMWLYPRITKAPEPSPLPLNQPATTLPETLPLTSAQAATSAPTVKTSSDCMQLCEPRCKKETNKRICRRSCMTCCDRCKCVPPGDYGTNRDKCGKCYTDMDYHGHKCP